MECVLKAEFREAAPVVEAIDEVANETAATVKIDANKDNGGNE